MTGKDRTLIRRLVVAAETDVGRVRQNNEDAYVVAPLGDVGSGDVDLFDVGRAPLLLAVSDGMGGAAAGEVASAVVVEALRRSLPGQSADWATTLREAVALANREVWAVAQKPEMRGAGATLTAVCVHGDQAHLAEVGDSRAYLLRDGELRLLTHDQSYVQLLVDAGAIKAEDAERSPFKNVILKAMGQHRDVRPDIGSIYLRPRDQLLVCSDGLSNELTDAQLRDVLVERATPQAACARLIALANEHGGNDNITVIVADVDEIAPVE